MKRLSLLLFAVINLNVMAQETKSLHDFKTRTLEGEVFDLASLKGKKVLIVNVASECGYTPQYETLEELYKEYGPEKFTIIAFPCNDFGGQEPGTHEEIRSFCTSNYGVTFPMMTKISVVGEDKDPLYAWLTEKSRNGKADAEVKWNFQKFLIDEEGNWVAMVPHSESPASEKILNWINEE